MRKRLCARGWLGRLAPGRRPLSNRGACQLDRNIRCGKTDVSDGEGVDQAAQRLAEDRWGGGAQRVLPTRRSEALTAGDPSIASPQLDAG